MYFRGLGTATPPSRYTKAECLAAFQRSDWFARLDSRSHLIARTVLQRDNGIEARRLALDSLDEVFAIDPDTLDRRFLAHAPTLAADAGSRALASAGLDATAIDAVVVSTCTGYLCPGLSGYVVERLGLRADVQAFDLVGQGCAAALPNLQLGRSLIARGRGDARAVGLRRGEQRGDVPRQRPGRADQRLPVRRRCRRRRALGRAGRARAAASNGSDGASLIEPRQRKALMFEQKDGMLRNILTREVPTLAADYAHRVLATVLERNHLNSGQIAAWIMHAGGRDVLLALERRFELDGDAFRYSAAMLREYGNLSSAFVYFVLEAALADGAPAGWWWLSSFGAGFSCHGALLRVE